VTFIRTTPEKLWQALTEPEFTKQFWFGVAQECEWKPGAAWRIVFPDGRVADTGEVVEIEPGRRLVLRWRHELQAELCAEGYSRMTYEIEQKAGFVQLTLTHLMETSESKFIKAISGGWPIILASLKSLLETGEALEGTGQPPKAR
jgi:uncharacterized protein YndB with AHSA1/START domain